MQGAYRRSEDATDTEAGTTSQLLDIQKELVMLRKRRALLEEQRKKILSNCNSTTPEGAMHYTVHSQGGPSDSVACNHTQLTRIGSTRNSNHSVIDRSCRIPSEAERLKSLKKNVFREMKESMRNDWKRDSVLVMGSFLLEDNPRVGTFGRERRFIPVQNYKGVYHLSTDLELMQRQKNKLITSGTASRRGEQGMNISNHWNDLYCSGPPGPGAYTPRYGKLAKPSVLTRK
ncbi:hypothetical protein C3747_29g223 [Trypanosoma cruzi]|uniref:Uncharacterized protein n=1 Tax=Trypanosoma cruzi TaxID=5693 RepID=A0A2V2X4L3_TRYCR|nr:hypothetical protein C3747_29g223 [Trypanosoma cruzi]